MPLDFRTRNALFLAKVESTAGTDASPAPGTDAVKVRDEVAFAATLQNLDEGYVQELVSAAPPIIGSGSGGFSPKVWMCGSAAPGTAPPGWATLLRGCAFALTLTAAAITGTAQAITSSSITLAAGASSTDNIYVGMPIDGTSGSNSGQRAWITAYNGSTKIATITPAWSGAQSGTPGYSIPANALLVPATLSQKTLSLYGYQHNSVSGSNSRLSKLLGAMGTGRITINPGQLAELACTFQGQLPAAPADVARPSAGVFSELDAQPFLSAIVSLGGTATKVNQATIDLGNTISQFPDPSQALGMDTGEVTNRVMSGTIVPPQSLVSARDSFSDWMASTSRSLLLAWGSATGKKVSILLPAIRYTGRSEQNVNGFRAEALSFRCTGFDSEAYICVS